MADDDFGSDFSGFDPTDNQQNGQFGFDHPLSGWADASNLKPEEIAQHIHDPEGFKDAMAAKNIPPPGFDLQHDGQGSFQPLQAYNTPTPSAGVTPPSTREPPGPP